MSTLAMITCAPLDQPLHFGATKELFGLYHAPAEPADSAVLLCPPLGQDMVRSHRLYRQLARALTSAGHAVLRFDYYGSGDSAGASAQLEWPRCIADTLIAATELRRLADCDRVIAFGARLGGSIALAASTPGRFARVIAWDTVLDGAAHVAALDAMQQAIRCDPLRFIHSRLANAANDQWLGFALHPQLRQQLCEWQPPAAIGELCLLDSFSAAGSTTSRSRLVAAGATVIPLPASTPWEDLHRLEMAILSPTLVDAVCAQLCGVLA